MPQEHDTHTPVNGRRRIACGWQGDNGRELAAIPVKDGDHDQRSTVDAAP